MLRGRRHSSSSSSSSSRWEENTLSLRLSELASFDLQSPATLKTLLLHARGGDGGPDGAPSFSRAPLDAAEDLRLSVWVLLREQHPQRQHSVAASEIVSPFCRVCDSLHLFLTRSPHAACLFLLPPAQREGKGAPQSASVGDGGGPLVSPEGEGTSVPSVGRGPLLASNHSLLEFLFGEAKRILSRLSLTVQGDDGTQQQQQQQQQQEQQQQQLLQQRVDSDRDSQQGEEGALEEAPSPARLVDTQGGRPHDPVPDSFQKPRPLKRRAAAGTGGGPSFQNTQGAPFFSSSQGGPLAGSGCRSASVAERSRQLHQGAAEEGPSLLCCCLSFVRGPFPATAALAATAAAECLLLQHLLLLLLRLTRALQATMICLATRAGAQCLGLHALHSMLLPSWRPQQQQQQQEDDQAAWNSANGTSNSTSSSSSSKTAAADAAAFARCLFDMFGALADGVDSFMAFKDLLRAPLPSAEDSFLGGPLEWVPPTLGQRGGEGPQGRGAPGQSERERMEEDEGAPLRHAPLSELRLQLLELVALLRQLSIHLPCGWGGPHEQRSKEEAAIEKRGPQEARIEGHEGGAPSSARMHGLLKAAVWLLSSEAPMCIKEAPLWLWGPLAFEVYVHPSSPAAADREQAAACAVGALQAAAVRAFAAGGSGAPLADAETLYSQIDASPGGVHAKDFSCLQNLVRLAWEALLPPSSPPLVEGPPAALVEGGPCLGLECVHGGGVAAGCMRDSLSPEEEEAEQQSFSRELALMQLGGGAPLGGLRGSSCLYTSAPPVFKPPLQVQAYEEKQQPHAFEQLAASLRRRARMELHALLQQQHIAEDCLEILSRGARGPTRAPLDTQGGLREKGGPSGFLPVLPAAPHLSNRSLGPTLPLLLSLLERMQSTGFAEDGESPKNIDLAVLTSIFIEAKLHTTNANKTV
ncbi:hypothetical protein Emag_005348 [Eimeria magna]